MNVQQTPVKVCFVSPKAYTLFNAQCKEVIGGAEVDCYLLAVELAKDPGFDVRFITADYGQPKVETRANVQIYKSLTFGQNTLAGAIKIWRAMNAANADVYFQEAASIGTALVAAFCKLNRKAFVYRTAHQDECDGTYARKNPVLGKLFFRALRSANTVITQNDTDQANLLKTASINSVVIRNAHYIPTEVSAKKEHILWVGRSAGFKKPHLFIDLAAQFPHEKFVMICQRATDDQHYEQLVEHARTLANVEFLNAVGFKEVESYFAAAKVLVCTSDSEGFPNTFVQACKNATPILSLKVDPDGFLEKNNCGNSCGGKWDVLVSELKHMLADNNYEKLGARAREYAIGSHAIETIIPRYKAIFKKAGI